jgi:hypothetical protein
LISPKAIAAPPLDGASLGFRPFFGVKSQFIGTRQFISFGHLQKLYPKQGS